MSFKGRRTNMAGVALIRSFEGLVLESYVCPAGRWTIGYGHTTTAIPGQRITEEQAEQLLRRDLALVEARVAQLVQVALNDNQFAALVCFAFNVGVLALARSSLLKKLNAGDYAAVPDELQKWVKVGTITLPGLIRRRAAEAALWNKKEKPS